MIFIQVTLIFASPLLVASVVLQANHEEWNFAQRDRHDDCDPDEIGELRPEPLPLKYRGHGSSLVDWTSINSNAADRRAEAIGGKSTPSGISEHHLSAT
jgi:hypothetical protein